MNKLTIIGRLVKDPELRSTTSGVSVCSFTVAVNRRQRRDNNEPDADFFKVTAWRERGETCAKYLSKGKMVCVIGPVSVSTYTTNNGQTRASLDVTAEEVEFLSPRNENAAPPSGTDSNAAPQQKVDAQSGFQQVEMDDDELPF